MSLETSPTQHGQARESLLQAAAELFAERGFEQVSIREIAARAGVRHGGVNYHFKGKREMYLEVLSRFGPPGNHVATGGNPELHAALEVRESGEAAAVLHQIVRSHLASMTAPPNPIVCGLLAHEMKRPEGPDEDIFQNVVQLRHRAIEHLISTIAPHITASQELRLLSLGITSQCLIYRLARPVAYRLLELDPKSNMSDEQIDQIATQIVATCLRGLRPAKGSQA